MVTAWTMNLSPTPNSELCDRPWSTDSTRRCVARRLHGSDRCLAHQEDRSGPLAKQANDGTIDLTDAEVTTDLGKELRDIFLRNGLTTLNASRATFTQGWHSQDKTGPAVFYGAVNFRGATFLEGSDFTSSTFCGQTNFGTATFVEGSDFTDANFCVGANFGGTRFGGTAKFTNAYFCGEPGFGSAEFAGGAHFDGTTFMDGVVFGEATFSDICNFTGAHLRRAEFKKVNFNGFTVFQGAFFENDATFERSDFLRQVSFRGTLFNGETNFGAVKFRDRARFDEASFYDLASFEEATFSEAASFDMASFARPAEFKRTTLAPQMFLGVRPGSDWMKFDAVRLVGPTELEVEHAHLCFNNVGLVEHLTIKGTRGKDSVLVQLCDSTHAKPVTLGEGVILRDTSFLRTTGLDLLGVADAQWQRAKGRTRRKILADEAQIDAKEKDKQRYVAVEGLYRQFRSGLESSKAAPAAADFYYVSFDSFLGRRAVGRPGLRRQDRWSNTSSPSRWYRLVYSPCGVEYSVDVSDQAVLADVFVEGDGFGGRVDGEFGT